MVIGMDLFGALGLELVEEKLGAVGRNRICTSLLRAGFAFVLGVVLVLAFVFAHVLC